jgi:hypothetical protein
MTPPAGNLVAHTNDAGKHTQLLVSHQSCYYASSSPYPWYDPHQHASALPMP